VATDDHLSSLQQILLYGQVTQLEVGLFLPGMLVLQFSLLLARQGSAELAGIADGISISYTLSARQLYSRLEAGHFPPCPDPTRPLYSGFARHGSAGVPGRIARYWFLLT
jgi:hypothetical protein